MEHLPLSLDAAVVTGQLDDEWSRGILLISDLVYPSGAPVVKTAANDVATALDAVPLIVAVFIRPPLFRALEAFLRFSINLIFLWTSTSFGFIPLVSIFCAIPPPLVRLSSCPCFSGGSACGAVIRCSIKLLVHYSIDL